MPFYRRPKQSSLLIGTLSLRLCYAVMALAIVPANAMEREAKSGVNTRQSTASNSCDAPDFLAKQWPDTDFSNCTIDLNEIISGGPPKDGIPPIDDPIFSALSDVRMDDREPVISVQIAGEARGYPLSILTWHEIVNDNIGGIPIAVTYCPLCNTTIIFDRRVKKRVLDFGTSGNLRHSDLIMYDR